jgi:hypothetical protein
MYLVGRNPLAFEENSLVNWSIVCSLSSNNKEEQHAADFEQLS